MRALCGAIITAGALIGLGLTCVGIGFRYQNISHDPVDPNIHWVQFLHLDAALLAAFVVFFIALLIGLGVAFVGLAYHHHRRGWEMHRAHGSALPGTGTAPPATGTGERLSV
jgi:hypothetical protein